MGRRYLVVDPGAALAENLAKVLGASAVVEGVARREQALELVRDVRFDAAVIHIRTGALLLSELRRIARGLPAVMVSSSANDPVVVEVARQGVMGVFGEPVDVARLARLLGWARHHGVIALVEDDEAVAEALAEALRERGFSPVTAHSLAEVKWLVMAMPFAAVVDVRLPGGSDGEALRQLAAQHPHLPVMAMSGHDEALHKQSAARYFRKPFRTPDLLDAVEQFHEAQRL
jgi:DNA-binding NtrC family response regulator